MPEVYTRAALRAEIARINDKLARDGSDISFTVTSNAGKTGVWFDKRGHTFNEKWGTPKVCRTEVYEYLFWRGR